MILKRYSVAVTALIVVIFYIINVNSFIPITNSPPQEMPRGTGTPTTSPGDVQCFPPIRLPLSPLEQELQRLYRMTEEVMEELNATYWPTDGTLLGLMRNGRVATDRDLDFQIHSTFRQCAVLLYSLRAPFARRSRIKSFKLVKRRHPIHGRIGRYVMLRFFREYGTFDTGVDFNCVFTDVSPPAFYLHSGVLASVPSQVFPLGRCLAYGKSVMCPRDGYSVLDALKPRYQGCMVFPHCMGNPTVSTRHCLSPHPEVPLAYFVQWTRKLKDCNYTSMYDHYLTHDSCADLLRRNATDCRLVDGNRLCFIQSFVG